MMSKNNRWLLKALASKAGKGECAAVVQFCERKGSGVVSKECLSEWRSLSRHVMGEDGKKKKKALNAGTIVTPMGASRVANGRNRGRRTHVLFYSLRRVSDKAYTPPYNTAAVHVEPKDFEEGKGLTADRTKQLESFWRMPWRCVRAEEALMRRCIYQTLPWNCKSYVTLTT